MQRKTQTHTHTEQATRVRKNGRARYVGRNELFLCCIIMMHGQKNELIAKHAADRGARSSATLE